MKGLYKLAVAFEKAAQGIPSAEQIRNISEKGPFGGAIPSHPSSPAKTPIDPYIQLSLNNLGYKPQIETDGILGPKTQKALDWFKRDVAGIPPTASPALVAIQIRNEAAKLRGKEPANQVAFKMPGSPDAASNPAGPPGSPIGPVGDHKIPGSISAEPTAKKNTRDQIKDLT